MVPITDDKWTGNGKGGIGATLYFQWLKDNKVGYRASFNICWEIFSKRKPHYAGIEFKKLAKEWHTHYYECGDEFPEEYHNNKLGNLIK